MRLRCLILASFVLIGGCSSRFALKQGSNWTKNQTLEYMINCIRTKGDFVGKFDLLWESEFDSKVIAPLNFGSGFVAVTGSKDKIRFFESGTSSPAGFMRVKGSAQSGFLIRDSLAVTVSSPPRNRLVCRNMRSGEELWKDRVKDIAGGSITSDNRLIVSSGAGGVSCYDLFDGTKIWSFETDGLCSAPPVVYGDFVIQPLDKGRIVGISVKDGSQQYEMTMPTSMASPVTVTEAVYAKAYAVDIAGNLTAFSPSNGSIAWTTSLNEPTWSSPAADSAHVVVATRTGKVIALDNSNGEQLWEYSATDVFRASPTICDGFVVVGTLTGRLISLKGSDGSKVDEEPLDGPIAVDPVFRGGRLFVATNAGTLFCFGRNSTTDADGR
jgi:outer membrane protein assembly factor BamB